MGFTNERKSWQIFVCTYEFPSPSGLGTRLGEKGMRNGTGSMKIKILLLQILLLISSIAISQTGTLRGKITDAETGEELIGAAVMVEGSFQGSSADLDGDYAIPDIMAGATSIRCTYISYESQTITGIDIKDGDISILDIKLKSVSVGLEEVVVSAKAVRNTESAILTMQKKSASVMDGISSQQISKSGDSDAAGAIGRITGVSVEGGKYVYVRGLGDRYSKTTLNGAEIPGLDPERNTVQMDIFPTNAIESMIVYKSFSANLNTFTGGLIDIRTKDFPEEFNLHFSASYEFNTQSSLNNDFLSYDGGKSDWIGFDDGTRGFPVNSVDIPLYPSDRNVIDETTRKFNKIMEPNTKPSFLNQNYSLSVGNQTKLFGKPLGYNIGINYKNEEKYYDDGERGIYKLTDANAEGLNKEQKYNETKGQYEALIGSLISLSYKLNNNNKLGYVLMYNHSGIKNTFYHIGEKPSDEFGMIIQSRELGFQERAILSNQLKGEHLIESWGKLKIDWIVSYTKSKQTEPDLRFFTNSFYPDAVGDAQFEVNPSKYKVPSRFNRAMDEMNLDNKVDFELPFTVLGSNSKFLFGGAYVYKSRGFIEEKIDYLSQVQYYNGSISDYLDDGNIGQEHPLYDPVTRQNYGLYVQNATDIRNSYTGTQSVLGAYAMVDMPLTEKFRMEVGLRYEGNKMESESKKKSYKKGVLDDKDILPAINLTFTLVEKTNIRLAYTRTLSRPTFREIAPFASYSPVAPTIVGNPDLKRTLIDNIDLKWEYFMKPGEVISFGIFYKNFTDPIEMVDNPVAINPEISYQNVGQARNYGFEAEFRKSLGYINPLRNINFGINFAYIQSEVSIDPEELESIRALVPDHPDIRPLFGQAPYIVNGLLGYRSEKIGLSANLVYNMTGERISLVTKGGTPDVYQQPVPILDFNIQQDLSEHFVLSFKAKNLLNSINKEVYSYKDVDYPFCEFSMGRVFGIGVLYKFR
ncbi:MAG: TonB-dependent receptor [Bacteroidetes bacterium]|nr:MAG: TonB-dependent receptor [Bacteroidota bacterium]